MFNQVNLLGFVRSGADSSYVQRVFDLYLARHQDELLGFGYHHYQQSGQGVVCLSCGYRTLFFGKGFFPKQTYQHWASSQVQSDDVLDAIASYNPETEVVVHLTVRHSAFRCLSRLSKKGLSLSVIHRQYLNRLLDYTAMPPMMSS